MAPAVTICPPMACRGSEPQPPQLMHFVMPVHRGGCIGFDDLRSKGGSMRFVRSKAGIGHRRKFTTPEWALSNASLRQVVLHYMELKVFSKKNISKIKEKDERKRFHSAIQALFDQQEHLQSYIKRCCDAFVAAETAAYKDKLAVQIANLDKRLILATRPETAYQLAVNFYRREMNSTLCAAESEVLTPWGARQIIRRLNLAAISLGFPAPERRLKPPPVPKKRSRPPLKNRSALRGWLPKPHGSHEDRRYARRFACSAACSKERLKRYSALYMRQWREGKTE